jgi:hypothetical protein
MKHYTFRNSLCSKELAFIVRWPWGAFTAAGMRPVREGGWAEGLAGTDNFFQFFPDDGL